MAGENLDILIDLMGGTDAPMGTLAIESADAEDFARPHVVKVVRRADGRALYFSRAGVPFARDAAPGAGAGFPRRFLKHLGIYAYRRDFLATVASLPPSPLERVEMLEQLRVLEAGYDIAVGLAAADSSGIDTPEQYAAFVARVGRRA
jgi:3-deoxy-manno-octulosonate cytidylyltransferase (CMP-KDO synthetase)